jgi:hypothetical protein
MARMIRIAPIILLAGCIPTLHLPTPVAYVGACPEGDRSCQRNADAQTLAYIGHPDAAMLLMCLDDNLAEVLAEQCDTFLGLY